MNVKLSVDLEDRLLVSQVILGYRQGSRWTAQLEGISSKECCSSNRYKQRSACVVSWRLPSSEQGNVIFEAHARNGSRLADAQRCPR